MPKARTRRKRTQPGQPLRGRLLTEALLAMVVLRRGRWTVRELADELGLGSRSAYRMLASLRAAGVTVEASYERWSGTRGLGEGHYTIPAEPLRKLLRLR